MVVPAKLCEKSKCSHGKRNNSIQITHIVVGDGFPVPKNSHGKRNTSDDTVSVNVVRFKEMISRIKGNYAEYHREHYRSHYFFRSYSRLVDIVHRAA